MNRQALSQLTVEQLRMCKQNLVKRIDDLKFFNLDLGRTNINLSEEYRVLRQRADKVKQGKMQKVRKAKGYTKNIYLQKDDQMHLADNQGKTVNKNNFNFNDLYKLGKSKVTSWIGGKGSKKNEQINLPNTRNNHFQNSQGDNHPEANLIYYHQVIVGDFPPAEVMQRYLSVVEDPIDQGVTSIVKHVPVIKPIPLEHFQRDPLEQEVVQIVRQSSVDRRAEDRFEHQTRVSNQNNQENYQRLYRPQETGRYVAEERQFYEHEQMANLHEQNNSNQVQEQNKKKTSMKNFEFDDLPGLGWKKLKGLISWGSKKAKVQEGKQEQAPVQQQKKLEERYQNNGISYQNNTNLGGSQQTGRKRTPIFGPSVNSRMSESQQEAEDQSMKEARIEKEPLKESEEGTEKEEGQVGQVLGKGEINQMGEVGLKRVSKSQGI